MARTASPAHRPPVLLRLAPWIAGAAGVLGAAAALVILVESLRLGYWVQAASAVLALAGLVLGGLALGVILQMGVIANRGLQEVDRLYLLTRLHGSAIEGHLKELLDSMDQVLQSGAPPREGAPTGHRPLNRRARRPTNDLEES